MPMSPPGRSQVHSSRSTAAERRTGQASRHLQLHRGIGSRQPQGLDQVTFDVLLTALVQDACRVEFEER